MARPRKSDGTPEQAEVIEAPTSYEIEEEKRKLPLPPAEAETARFVPIYAIEGLDDEERRLLVKSRMKAIIDQSVIPHTSALVKYSIGTNVPPKLAILDIDHRFVKEAWEFYMTNVADPSSVDFLEIVRQCSKIPERVLTKVVEIPLN